MSGDDHYSRRRLLQATAGASVFGAAGGAATGAYLSDWETFSGNFVGSGSFSLEIATATTGEDKEFDDGDFETTTSIQVPFPELSPGEDGVLKIGYRLCENPGWVWVRTRANDDNGDTDLGEYLDVSLNERPTCGLEDGGEPLFEGTLTRLVNDLDDGRRLGDDCIGCDSACLDFGWEFAEDAPAEVSEASFSFSFEFTAVQCRHNEDPENPWNRTR